jgi:hypothetical protein
MAIQLMHKVKALETAQQVRSRIASRIARETTPMPYQSALASTYPNLSTSTS